MANVLLGGYSLWPRPPEVSSTNDFNSSQVMAAADRLAAVFQIPKSGNIVAVTFLTRTVTVGATMDVRIETVSTVNGDPTGTLAGTNSNGAQVIANADDNVQLTTTLTQTLAVTRGSVRAVVLVAGAGANLNIAVTDVVVHRAKFPYTDFFTAAAWSKTANSPFIALKYDDGSYALIPGVYTGGPTTVVSFGSGSSPNERGLKFTLPFGASLAGFWLWNDNGHNVTVTLYDTDGTTVLKTATLQAAIKLGTVEGLYQYLFSSSVSLAGLATYRLTLVPTNAANDVTFVSRVFSPAAQEGALDGGTNLMYTSRTGTGAWTDDPLTRPALGLIIDGWDTTSPLPTSLATNRTLWRELTNEKSGGDGTGVVPNSVVDMYLDLGCKALNEIARYHYSDFVLDLTTETQEVTLPSDFVEAIHLLWNGIELQRSSMNEWRRNNIRWELEVSEGALGEWAIYRDKLVLRPKPSAASIAVSSTVTLRYVSTPPSVTLSGFDQLLTQHQFIPVFKGVSIWSSSHPDSITAQQRAQYYEQQFEREAALAAGYYQLREVQR